MPLPSITLTGNLTADPELRFLTNGTPVASLRVACNDRYKKDNEWVDGEPCFVKVNVWRNQAENLTQTLRKGDGVVISGRLKQNNYTDQSGANRVSFEVEADSIGADLRRSSFVKTEPQFKTNGQSDNYVGVSF